MSTSTTRPAPAGERILAALHQRHHVEAMALAVIVMTVQTMVEFHLYTALGVVTVISIGLRDVLVILLFAEEEGFIK